MGIGCRWRGRWVIVGVSRMASTWALATVSETVSGKCQGVPRHPRCMHEHLLALVASATSVTVSSAMASVGLSECVAVTLTSSSVLVGARSQEEPVVVTASVGMSRCVVVDGVGDDVGGGGVGALVMASVTSVMTSVTSSSVLVGAGGAIVGSGE